MGCDSLASDSQIIDRRSTVWANEGLNKCERVANVVKNHCKGYGFLVLRQYVTFSLDKSLAIINLTFKALVAKQRKLRYVIPKIHS